MDNEVKSRWEFLLQSRSDIRSIIENTRLVGGHISHDSNGEKIFHFITKKGTFTYNEARDEFERKLEIR